MGIMGGIEGEFTDAFAGSGAGVEGGEAGDSGECPGFDGFGEGEGDLEAEKLGVAGDAGKSGGEATEDFAGGIVRGLIGVRAGELEQFAAAGAVDDGFDVDPLGIFTGDLEGGDAIAFTLQRRGAAVEAYIGAGFNAHLLKSGFPGGGGEFEDPGFSELLWGGAYRLVFDDQADQVALGVGVQSVEGVFWRIGVKAADGAVHGGGHDTAETRGGVD